MMARRPIRRELRGVVTDIAGYCEHGIGLVGDTEMATLVFPLVIGFGEPFEIALGRAPLPEDRWHSFAAGLYPGPVLIRSRGFSQCVQVNFTPLGAHRFFGFPMSELASRMVRLDELHDPELNGLRERLGNKNDWNNRLSHVEAYVTDRLLRGSPGHGTVRRAYEIIVAARGNLRISNLARDLDCSRKLLSARFRLEFGLSPKSIARMVRFRNALSRADACPQPDWTDIAYSCGYADQAHLVREFSEFSGMSPARWNAIAA